MQRYFFFILILLASIQPVEAEEHLIVKLATENQLHPLVIFPIEGNQSSFDLSYIKELEKILAFDLSHNGKTYVTDFISISPTHSLQDFGQISAWLEKGVAYVVKMKIEGNQLKTAILDVSKGECKNGNDDKLVGNLDLDRRQIHKLADGIYRALFGSEGIATTKILYATNHKNGKESTKWISSIMECDYDGKNSRKVLGENNLIVNPIYVPPKKGFIAGAILFVSYGSGQPRLRITTLQNGQVNSLIKLRGSQFMPAISRSRDKIAFISDATGNPDLFMQPFNLETGPLDKPQQVFSAKHAAQGSPTFSPDGRKIAFVSNKDGSPRIYVLNLPAPGTSIKEIKPELITKKNRENSAPSWSPDGQKLAYCARSNGERQIWVYDFNTREERMLTKNPGDKENPSWAPNSLALVYNSSDKEFNNLFLLNLYGSGEGIQITNGTGDKRFPNWEPR